MIKKVEVDTNLWSQYLSSQIIEHLQVWNTKWANIKDKQGQYLAVSEHYLK